MSQETTQSSGGGDGREGPWYENGRVYGTFRRGRYMFPIDEQENDRLDIFHKFFRVARRDVLTSAMESLENRTGLKPRILDLGTGTGIWAIEVAEHLRNKAEVWGVDLNYSQPAAIPPSCTFPHAVDIEQPWYSLEEDFDLIHIRMLFGSIEDWPGLYAKCFRHLKPGAHFEQVEMDFEPRSANGPLAPNFSLVQWYNLLMTAMDQCGKPMRLPPNNSDRLRAAGFVNIQEEVIRVPLTPWSRDRHEQDMARWFNLGMMHGIEGYSLAPLLRILRMPEEDVRDLITRLKSDMLLVMPRIYCRLHIWTATKPGQNAGA